MKVHHGFDINSVGPQAVNDGLGKAVEVEFAVGGANSDMDGISPVAQKWMRRNGLQAENLTAIFSLGGDEIDLVAKKVPGRSVRAHCVLLLTGIAAYLGGGAARFTHEKAKETCIQYDPFDNTNFSKHIKEFAAEVAGNKESGYGLTARGHASATNLVREMIVNKAED